MRNASLAIVREIGVEIAAVGQPDFGIGIDTAFDILIFYLESPGETRERPHASSDIVLQRLTATRSYDSRAQCRNQESRQRSSLGRFDSDAGDAARLGVEPAAIEQNGLSDPPQPMEDKASGGPPGANPIEHHRSALDKLIAPCKFRRGRTGTGRVRVQPGIHIKVSYLNLSNFDKIT